MQIPNLKFQVPFGCWNLELGIWNLVSLDLEQLDNEGEFGIGRDDAAGALFAVSQVGGNDELALAADLHAGHALVPTLDDAIGAELKRKRPAAIDAAVELRAVFERAGVVHNDRVARLGFLAGAFLGVGVFQAGFGSDFFLFGFVFVLVVSLGGERGEAEA